MNKAAIALPASALLLLPILLVALIGGMTTPSIAQATAALDCAGVTQPGGPWRPPFTQPFIVGDRGFGNRWHPIHHAMRLHTGQDMVSLPGPGPVVAAAAGTIVSAGPRGGYGNAVVIDHGQTITTMYAHLARIAPALTPGRPVQAGQPLGIEGSTGTSTGNHLHFEVRRGDTPIDPIPFMLERGAPLNGKAPAPSTAPDPPTGPTPTTDQPKQIPVDPGSPDAEGGLGFALPPAGTPRRNSLASPPMPIPPRIRALYIAAANKYKIPWTLLAGIGMEETHHGRITGTSSAGARGLMQFMPATFATYGVDADGGGAVITSDADSIHSAANYLIASGVTKSTQGVKDALYAYNHADWYINDVLYYAHAYGGGTVIGDPTDLCPGQDGQGNPDLTPLPQERAATVLTFARAQAGDRYVVGATGPDAWDCSALTQAAFARINLTLPRTAAAQRDWLAAGNGSPVQPGQERPGDLIFTDSYLGPARIGHVAIVDNPANHTTAEARSSNDGVGAFTYTPTGHHRYEIWRVADLLDAANTPPCPTDQRQDPTMSRPPQLAASQLQRRTNDFPLTWEPFALAAIALLTAILLAAHLGRGIAAILAGNGWAWPLHDDLVPSALGVLTGDPNAGLAPTQTLTATPTLTRICVTLTELAAITGYIATLTAILTRWGPNRAKGMASRDEAETLLGRTRLRAVRHIIRPDLYGPPRRR